MVVYQGTLLPPVTRVTNEASIIHDELLGTWLGQNHLTRVDKLPQSAIKRALIASNCNWFRVKTSMWPILAVQLG